MVLSIVDDEILGGIWGLSGRWMIGLVSALLSCSMWYCDTVIMLLLLLLLKGTGDIHVYIYT